MERDQDLHDKLIVLATFSKATEAHCLCATLESNGIRACVANETSNTSLGASWFGPISAIWVEVLVFESDAEKALEIKNRLADDMVVEEEIPEWICGCGETVDAGFEICWSCSTPYAGSGDDDTTTEESED
ncbi:MAG: DUF2007 domain-containing protein [Planctomycetaceae bacterium]|nr:DUF2007 domain-containing protein [Planctomycetaceae bacterium]